MDELILAAIRRRVAVKITDLKGYAPARLRLADPNDVANEEGQLGFSFPPLLKRIYTQIGNGGFGPGYGLIGLTNGVPETRTQVRLRLRCAPASPDTASP